MTDISEVFDMLDRLPTSSFERASQLTSLTMDTPFELVFAELKTASALHSYNNPDIQHYRLPIVNGNATPPPQLELAGHYQELTVTFYAPGAGQGRSSLIVDTKGLDPLLRATLLEIRLEVRYQNRAHAIPADVRSNRKPVLALDSLSAELLDSLSLAARGPYSILVTMYCTFAFPSLPMDIAESTFAGAEKASRKPKDKAAGKKAPVEDLVLVFPWEGRRGTYLSTNFAMLAKASPYFAHLKHCVPIDGVFGWSRISSFKARRADFELLVLPHRRLTWVSPLLSEDLGPEVCTIQFRDLPSRHNEPDSVVQTPTAFLVLNHHSSIAFSAVLKGLEAGTTNVGKLACRGSARPVPADAIYRLARQLQLHDLAESALSHYGDMLSPEDAVSELFTATANEYPEIAAVIMAKLGLNG